MASTTPAWITINSTTGALNITTPEVSLDTKVDFYIISSVSGVTGSIQKKMRLIILDWSVQNWQKCSSSSSTTWVKWSSGYVLSSGGVWTDSSVTAKALSTTSTSVVIASSACVVLVSFLNASSIASLWLVVNQLQIFFLLLLARSYIK